MPKEKLLITNTAQYTHPLVEKKVFIANSSKVWPPYSAFHLAEKMFPIAYNAIHATNINKKNPICVDIGTGSGVLAILAKQYMPKLTVVATDLNSDAVKLAQHNWTLNKLPLSDLTTMIADGIDPEVIELLQTKGGADILLANLPQQPLVDGIDLFRLRNTQPAAWNIDPSHDPDGLGIFQRVLESAYQIMKPGGIALVSASSKQNTYRIESLLNSLVSTNHACFWNIVSKTRFNIPSNYDPDLVKHWRAMEQQDGIQRLFNGPNGETQYEHLNIAVYF